MIKTEHEILEQSYTILIVKFGLHGMEQFIQHLTNYNKEDYQPLNKIIIE